MSADFWSFVLPVSPADGARLLAKLRPRETLSDVVGPAGDRLHRFDRDGEYADAAAVAAAYGDDPRLPDDIGAAYVDAPIELLEALLAEEPMMSPNYPTLVALDRAVALPRGVDLLGGRAVRLLDTNQVTALRGVITKLRDNIGDDAIVRSFGPCIDRWGNGAEDAAATLRALMGGASKAAASGESLLLLGCVAP